MKVKIIFLLMISVAHGVPSCLTLLTTREHRYAEYFPGRLRKWNREKIDFDLIEAFNQNQTSICSVDYIDYIEDLTGKIIVVSGAVMSPYLMVKPDNTITGFVGDVWTTLQDALKFKSIYREPHKSSGDSLLEGGVDEWLEASAIGTYSVGHYLYTQQIGETHYALFVLTEGPAVSKWWYMNIFAWDLWSTSCGFVFGIAALFLFMYRLKRAICLNYLECNNEFAVPSFNLISVLGVMTGQGFQKIPQSWSLRFIVISALTMGMLISCGFSSTLTSYLAIRGNSLPFSGLSDLPREKTHSLCVRNDSNAIDRLYQKIKEDGDHVAEWHSILNKNCPNMSELAELSRQMCRPGFAYLEAPDIFLTAYRASRERCDMAQIPEVYWSIKLSFIQSRSATHRHIIDRYLMRLRSSGILKYLERKWIPREWPHPNDRQFGFKPVEFAHVDLISVALFVMMLVSGIMCVFENIWFRLDTNRTTNDMAPMRIDRLNRLTSLSCDFPSRQLDASSRRAWINDTTKRP